MSAFNAVEQYRNSAKAIIIIFELGHNLRFNDMVRLKQFIDYSLSYAYLLFQVFETGSTSGEKKAACSNGFS